MPAWTISTPQYERCGSVHRVHAEVSGESLWFESRDAPLAPAPEAFVGPLWIPALARGATIACRAPLDPDWLAGARAQSATYARWWDYPDRDPLAAPTTRPRARSRGRNTAACFTLGVDSFHLLLSRRSEIHALLYVHGIDTELADETRMRAIDSALRDVAASNGVRAIVVRTNLRQHELLRNHDWEELLGAALAAVGQCLAPDFGRLLIPSSASEDLLTPWGSHPETDPRWSSSAVAIEHEALARRRHKVQRIADEPLVWRHLRVCWENRAPTGNCSRCEKCVRTMVALDACGALARCEEFDTMTPLPALIDAIPAAPPLLAVAWEDNLALEPRAEVSDAVRRLIERTRVRAQRLERRRRRRNSLRSRLLQRLGWREPPARPATRGTR